MRPEGGDLLPRLYIGVSACLLGDAVRYDGTHRRHDRLIDRLGPSVEWIKVCPEVELGLGVPRERILWVHGPNRVRLVTEDTGRDITGYMEAFAERRLDDLAGISGYVFKSKSPSCGVAAGGLFAAAVIAHVPGLPVVEESELDDDDAVDRFAARVRDYAAAQGQA